MAELTLPIIMNHVRALIQSYQGSPNIKTTAFVINGNWVGATLPVVKGGSGAITADKALTNFGATDLGKAFFKSANQSAIRFARINADNSISFLDAADFRTAIGAGIGSGTVTSVNGTANRIVVTNPTTTPTIDIGTDVVTLTGVQALSNKTGLISQWTNDSGYITGVGGTTVGNALLNLTNPSAITFLRVNADNSVTALNASDFRTAIGATSGITIGTTTIASGTTTRILYNNAGVVGEYTTTGSGTEVPLSTSPTFITDIRTPLIIGGTAVGSNVIYKSTTGVGTLTVGAHIFQGGSNGATEIMRLRNDGVVLVGTTSPVGAELVCVQKNQNASTGLELFNTTAGASSQSYVAVNTNGSRAGYLQVFSSSFTPLGSVQAGCLRLLAAGTNGLDIAVNNNVPIRFWRGATEGWRIDANSQFNNAGTTGDASAILQINSTTKGFLLPRMTAAEGSTIASPANGLQIYVTDTNATFATVGFYGRENGAWVKL